MPAETILEHLTINGARAILWDDEVGSLEAGKRADLLLFDLDRPQWVPLHNPISNLVHAASGANVNTVVIDGKVIVNDRKFVNVDEFDFIERGRAVASSIAERTGLTKFGLPRWPIVQ
jgi:cytosine/adenosine deaminase-related metal-dependent hydrolase